MNEWADDMIWMIFIQVHTHTINLWFFVWDTILSSSSSIQDGTSSFGDDKMSNLSLNSNPKLDKLGSEHERELVLNSMQLLLSSEALEYWITNNRT